MQGKLALSYIHVFPRSRQNAVGLLGNRYFSSLRQDLLVVSLIKTSLALIGNLEIK
jgi:hypothetical protein